MTLMAGMSKANFNDFFLENTLKVQFSPSKAGLLAALALGFSVDASADTLRLTGASVYDITANGQYIGNGWDTTGSNGAYNLYLMTRADGADGFINSGNNAATSINRDLSQNGTYTFYFRADGGGFNWPTANAGLNLFFNGNVGQPGISAFVPFNTVQPSLRAFGNGGLGITNADVVPGANSLSFTSGSTRINLTNFSLNDYKNPADVVTPRDLVGESDNRANGLSDYSGVITLQVSSVPEPESWAMMGLGLGLLAFAAKKRHC